MTDSAKVSLSEIKDRMNLEVVTPEIDLNKKFLQNPVPNRPALQLAGFFKEFDAGEIQVIGNVEFLYLETFDKKERMKKYRDLFSYDIPCVIFCRGLVPEEEVLKMATEYNIPIFISRQQTYQFLADVVQWLNTQIAPYEIVHGVLIDVYGEGVLITGESGIGKSELALELIKRGHRLVADDAVKISKWNDETLMGTSPEMTRYLLELRGIGILDIKTLFGVQSVLEMLEISFSIRLEEWNKDVQYDRLGLEDEYIEIMGNKVAYQRIPIRPGRNMAVIIEAAAVNHRQKLMGYNAGKELFERVKRIKDQEHPV